MNKELIKTLVLDTGCSENIAEWMLEVTSGNVDKAKNIILSMPKNIVVLFLTFSLPDENIFGAFLWGYNKELAKPEFLDVLATNMKGILDISPNLNIPDFKKQFETFYPSDQQYIKLTNELREFLSSQSNYEEFIKFVSSEEIEQEKIKDFFQSSFSKFFASENISLNLNVSLSDAFQLNISSKPSDKKDDTSESPAESEKKVDYKSESVVILKSQPIISPINGKPIPKFKKGDKLFVDISDTRDIGVSLKKLLEFQREKEGLFDHIYGTVQDMEYSTTTENVTIMIEFGPGIFGKMIVNRDLKVEVPIEKKENEEDIKNSSIFIWLVILFIVVFILLLILKK